MPWWIHVCIAVEEGQFYTILLPVIHEICSVFIFSFVWSVGFVTALCNTLLHRRQCIMGWGSDFTYNIWLDRFESPTEHELWKYVCFSLKMPLGVSRVKGGEHRKNKSNNFCNIYVSMTFLPKARKSYHPTYLLKLQLSHVSARSNWWKTHASTKVA